MAQKGLKRVNNPFCGTVFPHYLVVKENYILYFRWALRDHVTVVNLVLRLFFIRLWRETERERISLETHGTRVRIIPCQKHPRATLPFSSLLAPSILFYFSSGFPPFDDSQSTNIYFSFGQVWFFYYRKCNLIKSVRLNSMLFFFLQFLTIYSLFNFFNNVCFTSFSTIRWGKQCIIE